MPSRENGFATATLELLSGYPAYFYLPGDGDYICAVDDKYGLPIRLAGDANPDIEWICGFNRAVAQYVEQHGLPWNSRLSSLNLLSDLRGYFSEQASQVTQLKLNAKAFRPEGFGFALSFEDGSMGFSVKLEADRMFRIFPGFRG